MAALAQYFPGNSPLIRKGADPTILPSDIKNKYVFFYFSASWCPPCRAFTPCLVEFYNKHHAEMDFDVVLVTRDAKKSEFEEYYGTMPWLAVPFEDQKENQWLSMRFNLRFIPHLFLVEAETGIVVTDVAREMVETLDPEGSRFPWPYSRQHGGERTGMGTACCHEGGLAATLAAEATVCPAPQRELTTTLSLSDTPAAVVLPPLTGSVAGGACSVDERNRTDSSHDISGGGEKRASTLSPSLPLSSSSSFSGLPVKEPWRGTEEAGVVVVTATAAEEEPRWCRDVLMVILFYVLVLALATVLLKRIR